MQRIRISTKALLAVGLVSALAADASVANAQTKDDQVKPRSEDKTTPKTPQATMPEKSAETRPGPLDVVVQFQGTAADIDIKANATLDQTAEWLKEDPTRSVTIEIHPEDAARTDLDTVLVEQRADATRRYLVSQGATDTQIRVVTTGVAQTGPVARNHRAIFLMTLGTPEATASIGIPADSPIVEPTADPPPPTTFEPVPTQREAVLVPVGDGDPSNDHLLTPFGMAITIGGGVTGFLDDDARAIGDVGGGWEARLTFGTRTPLAFEAAYVGSAQQIDALGLDSSAVLLGTAIEGDLRLNFTTTFLQPYVFGGLGYTRYDITNDDFNTSSVNDSEEMGHIPFGAGLGFQYRGVLFDLRGTMRAAFNDDLVNEPAIEDDPLDDSDTRTDLDSWSAAARVGWEF
jgi:outer membrane protein OmpA-like peptidoglycan-associated protein